MAKVTFTKAKPWIARKADSNYMGPIGVCMARLPSHLRACWLLAHEPNNTIRVSISTVDMNREFLMNLQRKGTTYISYSHKMTVPSSSYLADQTLSMNHIAFAFSCLFVAQCKAQEPVTKIGIIGCHNQGQPAPTIPYFADSLKPDYCIWIGDNVYADTETDPQHILRQLQVLENKPGYQKLRDNAKFMVTWDDHDYGLNDAGKGYIFKEESKQIHRKFWRLENEIPSDQDGVYYAKLEKQPNGKAIQFIMLDGRSNKDEPGPNADALGENQWKWLETQLKQKADLRFILCGYQVLLKKPTRWEAWVRQGKSRQRLLDLIKSTGADQIVFVTGDQHYVEVLHSPNNVDYKTFEIMAAGINKNEVPGIATNRSMKADKTIHSAPLIEVHWSNDPYITFKNYDVLGNRVNSQFTFKLSQIGWKK